MTESTLHSAASDAELVRDTSVRAKYIEQMYARVYDDMQGVVTRAIARNDVEELHQLVQTIPCAMWRAELRGALQLTGQWKG